MSKSLGVPMIKSETLLLLLLLLLCRAIHSLLVGYPHALSRLVNLG